MQSIIQTPTPVVKPEGSHYWLVFMQAAQYQQNCNSGFVTGLLFCIQLWNRREHTCSDCLMPSARGGNGPVCRKAQCVWEFWRVQLKEPLQTIDSVVIHRVCKCECARVFMVPVCANAQECLPPSQSEHLCVQVLIDPSFLSFWLTHQVINQDN